MTLEDWGWSPHFARLLQDGEQAGRVLATSRGRCRLGTPAGECDAVVSGRAAANAERPVAGDWVVWEGPRVMRVLPRRSQLSRKAAGTRTDLQVLAANVDVCFLISGLDGDLNLRRLDRYLVMTRRAGIEPVVVLNKTDLALDLPGAMAGVRRAAPGVPAVAVSAARGDPTAALELFRPLLTAMKQRNQFEPFMSNAIGDDVGRVRNHQLARTHYTTWPAHLRLGLEKINCVENALRHECRILFGILGDVLAQRNQVLNCLSRPDDFHRGALVSPRLPQVFNQVETFSCETVFPASISAIPV
jgi:hypothetical protein